MANAKIPGLAGIRQRDPDLGRALEYLEQVTNNIGQQTNASPVGVTPAPQPHSAISVLGGAGILDIAITDSTPQFRAKSNFVEVATNPSFENAHVIEVGAGRNIRLQTGPGVFHVRSYGAYNTSGPSDPINHAPVDTSGLVQPPMQSGQGSGTGGGGYGSVPFNTIQVPKR